MKTFNDIPKTDENIQSQATQNKQQSPQAVFPKGSLADPAGQGITEPIASAEEQKKRKVYDGRVIFGDNPKVSISSVDTSETAPLAGGIISNAELALQKQDEIRQAKAARKASQEQMYQEQRKLATATGEVFNEEEARKAYETLDPMEQERNELNTLIMQKTNAYKQGMLDEQGKAIPQAFITGRQRLMQQMASVEISELSGLLQAKNNEIESAKDTIERGLDLKYKARQAQLKKRELDLDIVRQITGELKSEELGLIKEEKERLGELKAQEAQMKNLIVQNAGSIPTAVARKAMASDDYDAAMDMIYPYLGVEQKLNIQAKRTQIHNMRMAEKRARAAANSKQNSFSIKKLEVATKLRKEQNALPEVKDAKDMEANTTSLIVALNKENGVADIAAINQFQRLVVDPGVSVREGDVSLLQTAQSFSDKSYLKTKGYMKGDKLTDEGREKMKELVLDVYDARLRYVEENIQPIKNTAEMYEIDYEKYIGKQFSTSAEINERAEAIKPPEVSGYTTESGVTSFLQNEGLIQNNGSFLNLNF